MKNLIHEYFDEKKRNQYIQNLYEDACQNGEIQKLKEAIYEGADARAMNGYGLRTACEHGHAEIVEYILEKCFTVSSPQDTRLFLSALSGAALDDNVDIVKIFIQKDPSLLTSQNILKTNMVTNVLYEGSEKIMIYLCEDLKLINHENKQMLDSFFNDTDLFKEENTFNKMKKLWTSLKLKEQLQESLDEKKSPPKKMKI